ncbi:MAG: hypothetical protein SVU32_00215 [Candidatus Nanohaloarchaea archaeon]|nr:hypothetical protein [Candidatus Nanohaloarchaea archaeon]
MMRNGMADYMVIVIISAVFLVLTVWALVGGLMSSPSVTYTLEKARNNLQNFANKINDNCNVHSNFQSGVMSHTFESQMSEIQVEAGAFKARVLVDRTFEEDIRREVEATAEACESIKICSPGSPGDDVNYGCSGGYKISSQDIRFKVKIQDGGAAIMPVEG